MRTHDSGGWWASRLAGWCAGIVLLSSNSVTAQETCTTVEVTGGEATLYYEYDSDTALWSVSGTTQVLQVVSLGDARLRRSLMGLLTRSGGVTEGRNTMEQGARRRLDDDNPCETQMWIMADTEEIEEDGFPYYAAFDCADDPADIVSTWILVECEDCVEASDVAITCAAEVNGTLTESDDDDDDDGFFTVPVIAGIAAGGVVACLILGCCVCWCRKSQKGSNSFADDSEHSISHKQGGAVVSASEGGSGPTWTSSAGNPPGAGGPGIRATSVKGAHAAPMQARSTMSGASYTKGGPDGNGYDGYSAPPLYASSSNAMGMKDSMAAAAAAAAARSGGTSNQGYTASSASGGGSQSRQYQRQQQAGVSFDEDGNTMAPRDAREPGENIVWSAGQNYVVENEISGRHIATGESYRRPPGEYDDSAAGSVFSLNPDNVPDRAYYDDASVQASSPGGYSEYSHFTAGGHTAYPDTAAASRYGGIRNDQSMYSAEGSDMSWSGEGEADPLRTQRQAPPPTYAEAGDDVLAHPLEPLPTLEPVVAPESPIAQARQQLQQNRRPISREKTRMRSPAGLVARADRSATRESADGSRRSGSSRRDMEGNGSGGYR